MFHKKKTSVTVSHFLNNTFSIKSGSQVNILISFSEVAFHFPLARFIKNTSISQVDISVLYFG